MLTGSAVPADTKDIHHTGTGRYGWLTMRPMSLWESGDSTGEISLSDLFLMPDKIGALNKLTLPMLAFVVCRGGWPKALQKKTEKAALLQATEYYKAITNSDISRVDNVNVMTERAKRIMRSYARHQGAQASNNIRLFPNHVHYRQLLPVHHTTWLSYRYPGLQQQIHWHDYVPHSIS